MDDKLTTRCQLAHQSDQSFREDCYQLFQNIRNASFHQHPDWLFTCGTYLTIEPLLLVLVYDSEQQPVLLLPVNSKQAARRVRLLRHEHVSLSDILAHNSLDQEQLNHALEKALHSLNPIWSDVRGWDMPSTSTLIEAANGQLENCLLKPGRQSAHFDCSQDTLPVPGKLRRNLNRLRKKLESQSDITVDTYTEGSALTQALEQFMLLEKSGWKGRGSSTAIDDDQQLKTFYQQLLVSEYPGLQAVISLLRVDNKPIAAQFGVRCANTLNLLKIAYDEDFSPYSPGSLLLMDMLAKVKEMDIDTLSLVTAPIWAERWHPSTTQAWHLCMYNTSIAGKKQKLLDQGSTQIKHGIKKAIGQK